MSDDALSLNTARNGQHSVGDTAEFLREENSRVGFWLASRFQWILLSLLIIEIPLQLDIYLFHDLEDARFGAISGFNVSLTTICLILLYAQWLPRLVVESRPVHICKTLTVYLFMVAASILWASDKSRTLFDLFLLLQAFLVLTYVINVIQTRKEILIVVSLLVLGLFIQGALMVTTRVYGDDLAFGPVEFEINTGSKRVTGSFGSPNVASSFIALLLAPSLSLLLMPVSRKLKFLAVAAIVLATCGLILTLSRGGWMAAAISIAIFCVVAYRKSWLPPFVFVGLVFSALIVSAAFAPMLYDRLFGDDGGSAASRMPLIELSKQLIQENPLGVGANNWDLVAGRQAEMTQFREEWFFLVHNKYLLVLAETGWLGLIAFASFLISIVVTGWRAVKKNDRVLSPLALGLTSAFIGQVVHLAFDVFNSRVQLQMMCLIAALIIAVSLALNSSNTTDENLASSASEDPAMAAGS